jgi:hypothetical protein
MYLTRKIDDHNIGRASGKIVEPARADGEQAEPAIEDAQVAAGASCHPIFDDFPAESADQSAFVFE